MTVNTSAIPAAWNALVAAAQAAFASTVLICDGPIPVVDLEAYQDRVTIGWDGDEQQLSDAVTGTQTFNALNRGVTKDETFEILCSVTHWDGNNSIPSARTKAFALLATFELLLRGYPPNGSGDVSLSSTVLFAGVGGDIRVLPALTADGAAVTVIFHVVCRARLTGA